MGLQSLVGNQKVEAWLTQLELEVHDVNLLFRLLDNGDGSVSYEEFLDNAIRLKGQARSADVIALLHQGTKLMSICESNAAMCELLVRSSKRDGLQVDWNMPTNESFEKPHRVNSQRCGGANFTHKFEMAKD